ncbi:MAG: SpoIVB peptidase S55 domain-containing protein [Brevinematia bacterium]
MTKKVLIIILFLISVRSSFGYEILPFEKLEKGMKGYSLTRWNNNEVKRFNIEVIGTLRNNPKSGVVIAKINDEEISKTGVVAGMSGSPVYIDGKLAGAIAFTWNFLKEPIVGITPIEEMIKLRDYEEKTVSLPSDFKYTTPILLSGLSKQTKEFLEEKFKDKNLTLIDSFSLFLSRYSQNKSLPEENKIIKENPFKEGDAIGINLVSGDVEITAIGTVTLVESNKIFGLGHPAFLGGKVEIPVSEVEILTIVPRQDISFKVGIPKNIVGTMKFDGSSGIFAEIGQIPKTIELSVNVDNELYYYNIANVKELFPTLLPAVLSESILRTKGIFGEGNIEINCNIGFKFEGVENKFSIDFKDIIPVYSKNIGYSLSISDVASIIDFLIYNPVFKANIDKIHVSINTKPVDIGFITFIIPSKQEVSPGEKLKITVGIKKFRDEIITREFELKIPNWVKPGTKITIGAMNKATRAIQKLTSFPESMTFDTYEKLYKFIYQDLRVEKLLVFVEIPSVNFAIGGYTYNLLPNYLSTSFLSNPKNKNTIPYTIEEESLEDFPITGSASTYIFVK